MVMCCVSYTYIAKDKMSGSSVVSQAFVHTSQRTLCYNNQWQNVHFFCMSDYSQNANTSTKPLVKIPNMKFHDNSSDGTFELFHVDGQTDRQTLVSRVVKK